MVDFPIDPVATPEDPASLRLRIQGLFDSYHDSDVDFLAENIQNSVDTLEDKFENSGEDANPKLEIDINTNDNIFTIMDNGSGISDEVIAKLGRPANSDKLGGSKRGYKGVGLSFAAWSAKKYIFETKRPGEETVSGILDGGRNWIEGEIDEHPVIDDYDYGSEFLQDRASGTVMEFHLEDDSSMIKFLQRLNEKGIRNLLKTKTAIGYVNISDGDLRVTPDWVEEAEILFTMSDRDPIRVNMNYEYPHELEHEERRMHLDEKSGLSIEELEEVQGTNKIIFTEISSNSIGNIFLNEEGEVENEDEELYETINDQEVSAYGAFVDRKGTIENYNEDFYVPNPGRGRKRQLVNDGIHVSTATMPCGDRQRIELSYGGGNANRLYFLFDFEDASPDEGRKTYSDEVDEICERVARYYASEEFVPNRKLLIQHDRPHGPTESDQEMSVHEAIETAEDKADISLDNIGPAKIPGEEQEVVGLFHSLLGANFLKGYEILATYGSQEKYDGVFQYDLELNEVEAAPDDSLSMVEEAFTGSGNTIEFPSKILEYKYQSSSLIEDFENGRKSLDDIKLLVSWTKGDTGAFSGASDYRLTDINNLSPEKQFYGSTHFLKPTDSTGKIHTIILEEVINEL